MTLSQVYSGPVALLPLDLPLGDRSAWRTSKRHMFEHHLYGALPPEPETISVQRVPLGQNLWHLKITIQHQARRFQVDAALWLPSGQVCETLIVALDFLGPMGVLSDRAYPIDPMARIYTRPELGTDGCQHDGMRGATAYRWPIEMFQAHKTGLLLSCYGSWAPDDPARCHDHGVAPLTGVGPQSGALSLWAWALMRLADVARTLPECIDATLCVAGHSRLGKAALWAAGCDTRFDAVFANNAGCAGPALSCHPKGETLDAMHAQFPHWLSRSATLSTTALPVDQHHLIAMSAPRGVYLACACDDLWSDPAGSYMALGAAAKAWSQDRWADVADIWQPDTALHSGPLGWHLRRGGHDMLPYDWMHVLTWLDTITSN